VAPIAKDSGLKRGQRVVAEGRSGVRRVLYRSPSGSGSEDPNRGEGAGGRARPAWAFRSGQPLRGQRAVPIPNGRKRCVGAANPRG
jgi:hypothetical protein